MNKLFLVLLLIANSAFAITGNKVWRVPSGGSLPSWGPVNLADNINAITGLIPRDNLPSVGQQISSSSASFSSTTSGSYIDVTNLSVTITTTGRPVLIFLQPDGTGGTSDINTTTNSGFSSTVFVQILRGATPIFVAFFNTTANGNGSNSISMSVMPGSVQYMDVVAAGTYTYKVQGKLIFSGSMSFQNCVLVAREL